MDKNYNLIDYTSYLFISNCLYCSKHFYIGSCDALWRGKGFSEPADATSMEFDIIGHFGMALEQWALWS